MQSALNNVHAQQQQARLGTFDKDAATTGAAAVPEGSVRAATSAQALQQTPRMAHAHGREIPVYGADDRQLGIIQRSLERLPAEHAAAIPRVIVADQISRDPRYRGGGATVPEHDGTGRCRLEVTTAALTEQSIREYEVGPNRPQEQASADQLVSQHVLHEAAHIASQDGRQELARGANADNLGHVVYRGRNRGTDPRGEPYERFAVAYGQYLLDPKGFRELDPQAAATVERCMAEAHARLMERAPPGP